MMNKQDFTPLRHAIDYFITKLRAHLPDKFYQAAITKEPADLSIRIMPNGIVLVTEPEEKGVSDEARTEAASSERGKDRENQTSTVAQPRPDNGSDCPAVRRECRSCVQDQEKPTHDGEKTIEVMGNSMNRKKAEHVARHLVNHWDQAPIEAALVLGESVVIIEEMRRMIEADEIVVLNTGYVALEGTAKA